MTRVHATAIVHAQAELAATVTVGPYSVIGSGVQVGEGIFRATMQVRIVNEGPVTLLLDSKKLF